MSLIAEWSRLLDYIESDMSFDPTLRGLVHKVSSAIGAVKFEQRSWRDELAKSAMTAMLASPELMECVTTVSIMEGSHCDKLSEHAYKQADSMIKVRDR